MGYIRHHGMLLTSWDLNRIRPVYIVAKELFAGLCSPLDIGAINEYWSFAIFPDGSKEGWEVSNAYDAKRQQFVEYLKGLRYDDGSSPIDWVLVQYGDDNGATRVVDDSDDLLREHHGEVEVEEVEVQVNKPLSIVVRVRLDQAYAEKLRYLAEIAGRGVTTLTREMLQAGLDMQLLQKAQCAQCTHRYVDHGSGGGGCLAREVNPSIGSSWPCPCPRVVEKPLTK